jgi:hypothetical protein
VPNKGRLTGNSPERLKTGTERKVRDSAGNTDRPKWLKFGAREEFPVSTTQYTN